MYHVAVVSRWRGLCKHKPTETTPPPLLPIPACHTFDLAAGGPRSSSTAQPLLSADADADAARRAASSSTPVVQKCLPPPRLASCFPWRHGALPIYLFPAHRPPPAPSSVRWPSPHSPAQRSLSEKGPRRANARQVYCDTRILMLVCPASAESLSQTDPCAWRTMALALSLEDASPEYQVFPVLSLILILILLMLLAACCVRRAACWPTIPWLPPLICLIYHLSARPLFPSSLNTKPSHSFLGAIPFFSSRVFNS